MKKVNEIIRPYLSIIFGALLVLVCLNWLSGEGASLALGIVAIILGGLFIATGVLGIVLGDKLSPMLKKVFSIVCVSGFALFLFTEWLLTLINAYDVMGPTSWVIYIVGMVASLGLAVLFIVGSLVENKLLERLVYLFAAIFVLALLLQILFDVNGNPIVLGAISILWVVLYALFVAILFNSLPKPKVEEKVEE